MNPNWRYTSLKEKTKKLREVLSWVILIAMCCLMVFTVYNARVAMKTGESKFLFGFRPVLVLTGSMEPYMMTNGLALTRQVDSMADLEVGDVVTYHLYDENGELMRNEGNVPIRITHRIISIEGDDIYTKGDNNNVDDGFALGLANIEAEVVGVFNGTAWLADKWQTTSGKVMLIAFPLALVLLVCTLDMLRKSARLDVTKKAAEKNTALPAEDGRFITPETTVSVEGDSAADA